MKLSMLWPILLMVSSELFYQVCARSTPAGIHPMASLSVTYAIGAAVAAAMYFALNRGGNLLREYGHINWATLVMGIVIVGLEFGTISMYKVGWTVSTGPVTKSVCTMIALTVLGVLAFHDALTTSKVIGVALCLAGIIFINK